MGGNTLHAAQLNGQDLCVIARAHWRELKEQIPDGPSKQSMQALLDELTYRTEQHTGGSRQRIQGSTFENAQGGGSFGDQQPGSGQQLVSSGIPQVS